ncbi:MAG: HEPN domain-containing protein [Melioribacter sp.]|uniref:HEPN domain-containing protein n=1 Tax=Rosettibacter primus TaxID=3111523 RepID=UPI00247BEBC8|nr:HEPN domain-containing protein [Melioribacter sp.]
MNHSLKELAIYRVEKAKNDLEAAEKLLDENLLLQSINRSYYAMFHAIRALLAFDKVDSKKHSGIIHLFNQKYISTGKIDKKYLKIVSTAFNIRIQSDYDDFYIISCDDSN